MIRCGIPLYFKLYCAIILVLFLFYFILNSQNVTSLYFFYNKSTFLASMKERRELVEQVCSRMEHTEWNEYKKLFLVEEANLLWCPVFKASSSNWHWYLIHMKKDVPKEKLEELLKVETAPQIARNFYPEIKSENELQMFYKKSKFKLKRLLIVRHPFERLVSAFRDKLEKLHSWNMTEDYFYKGFGRHIYQKYRKHATKRFGQDFFNPENNFGSPIPVRNKTLRNEKMPIFWEFVHFILDNKEKPRLEPHWRPIWFHCNLCQINYDYILKVEDLATEEKHFLRMLEFGLGTKIQTLDLNLNQNKNYLGGLSSLDVTKLYFQQLNEEEILALYKVYELDFKLFGYDYRDVLS